MEFSDKLKSLRTQANLTQNELAEKLMISRQAISNYEQDRGYPSIDILVGMSKLFNISLDELLLTGIRKKNLKDIIISVGLLFFGSIISLLSAYLLRQKNDLLLIFITFAIGIYIIPFMYLFVYLLFQYKPPKKINRIYGYRTKASMTNQLTWDYAQEYFSRVFAKIAIALLVLNIPFIISTLFLSLTARIIIGCVLIGMQTLSLFIPIVFVEKKLKTFFVENK